MKENTYASSSSVSKNNTITNSKYSYQFIKARMNLIMAKAQMIFKARIN